jgi:hypothetical protein
MEALIVEEHDMRDSSFPQQPVGEPALIQLSLRLPSLTDLLPAVKETDKDVEKAAARTAPGKADRVVAEAYLDLINDRIDRGWLRPKVAMGAPMFSCHVRSQRHHRTDYAPGMR